MSVDVRVEGPKLFNLSVLPLFGCWQSLLKTATDRNEYRRQTTLVNGTTISDHVWDPNLLLDIIGSAVIQKNFSGRGLNNGGL